MILSELRVVLRIANRRLASISVRYDALDRFRQIAVKYVALRISQSSLFIAVDLAQTVCDLSLIDVPELLRMELRRLLPMTLLIHRVIDIYTTLAR